MSASKTVKAAWRKSGKVKSLRAFARINGGGGFAISSSCREWFRAKAENKELSRNTGRRRKPRGSVSTIGTTPAGKNYGFR